MIFFVALFLRLLRSTFATTQYCILFVTDTTVSADVGVSGFDSICSVQGSQYGLGSGFQALVGTDSLSPNQRLPNNGIIVDVKGQILAMPGALFQNPITHETPVLYSNGNTTQPSQFAWFGGNSSGGNEPDSSCSNWSSTSSSQVAAVGAPHDSYWMGSGVGASCNTSLPVYCIETTCRQTNGESTPTASPTSVSPNSTITANPTTITYVPITPCCYNPSSSSRGRSIGIIIGVAVAVVLLLFIFVAWQQKWLCFRTSLARVS